MKSQDLRPGMAIELDGQLWLVTQSEHVKPGKGPAYAQVKLKNVKTGTNVEKRFRSTEDVEQAVLDRREMEYLYSDADGAVFMDTENYEQRTIDFEALGEGRDYLTPNLKVIALVYEGNIVNVELPGVVEMEVTDTPPGIRDATKTNQLKEATTDTGLKTKVPPFIEPGERIKVSTETGEYMGRA